MLGLEITNVILRLDELKAGFKKNLGVRQPFLISRRDI
jgi:hypothetical protein